MPVYTTVAEVKKILRSSTGNKVRMSDNALRAISIRNLKNQKSSSDLKFNSSSVTLDESFVGSLTLYFEFTSATDFDVSVKDSGVGSGSLYIGSGDTSSAFSYDLLTVSDTAFTGTPNVGDTVTVDFQADISIEMAEQYITDVEVILDSMMEELFYGYRDPDLMTTAIFTSGEVPPEVSLAAKYMAAYYIFVDTFAIMETGGGKDTYSFTARWKKRAETTLQRFVRVRNRTAPFIAGFPLKIERSGVRGIANGVEDANETYEDMSSHEPSDDEIFDRTE